MGAYLKKIIWLGIGTTLILSLLSCGYEVASRSFTLPSWIEKVYVAPWENVSNELLLGNWITQELRRQVIISRRLELAEKDKADVILSGAVVEVESGGLSYKRYDRAVERRIYVTIEAVLTERKSGKQIWKSGPVRREEPFLVGGTVMETESLKGAALKKISRDLAELLYHRITENY